jgi:ribosomal protein L37AE/L43A
MNTLKKVTCPECGHKMDFNIVDKDIIWDCENCFYTPAGKTAGFDVYVNSGELWKACTDLDEALKEAVEAKKQFEIVAVYQIFTDGTREIVCAK